MKIRCLPSFESLSSTVFSFLRLRFFLPTIFWSKKRHCRRNWRRKWRWWRRRTATWFSTLRCPSWRPRAPPGKQPPPSIGRACWLCWKPSGRPRQKAGRCQSIWGWSGRKDIGRKMERMGGNRGGWEETGEDDVKEDKWDWDYELTMNNVQTVQPTIYQGMLSGWPCSTGLALIQRENPMKSMAPNFFSNII